MSDISLNDVIMGINRMGQPASVPPIKKSTDADSAYEAIVQQIDDFQSSLDSEHEVSMEIASFSQGFSMSVTDIGYANPHLIVR